jgi:phosphopantetheinyl transferase
MAEIFKRKDRDRELIVWEIEEPLNYFLSRLPAEMQSLPSENEERNLEWLASRYILTLLVPDTRISKNQNKKPHLIDDIRYISISHTLGYAACMVSHLPCGIDIELDHPRIYKLATKYNLPDELDLIKKDEFYQKRLYQIWCAKEAMYKAFGLGGIDFKKDLWVEIDALLKDDTTFEGSLIKEGKELVFKLNYIHVEEKIHLVFGEML